MKDIKLHDLVFEPFITAAEIKDVVHGIAEKIDRDYEELNPILLIVLNGAFIFAADLVRQLSIPLRLEFVKVSSYKGTQSSGKIREDFLWKTPLEGQHVLIVEDIVDTGHTLAYLKEKIRNEKPASLEITCLLKKPAAYQYPDNLKYEGKSIPNDFVVGYGLDYNDLGRDLDCIYRKKDAFV
jgi:hypoxanthine phosphoribosyltransferase